MRPASESDDEHVVEEVFTPDETAKKLKISDRKLWSLKSSGEIAHLKIGRLTRYSASSIRAFIERSTQDTSD